MPLSPNEIRDRALAFARDWQDERREKAEAQTFWNEFFKVFGISRRRVASFEEPVRRARQRMEGEISKAAGHTKGSSGFIDLFWKGTLIAEHKSAGKDLDTAYEQALGYFEGLPERDLPRYVVVSDFARIRLYDLDEKQQHEFPLTDIYDPLFMPPALRETHTALDRAVDAANGKKISNPMLSAWLSCSTSTRNTPRCCRRPRSPSATAQKEDNR